MIDCSCLSALSGALNCGSLACFPLFTQTNQPWSLYRKKRGGKERDVTERMRRGNQSYLCDCLFHLSAEITGTSGLFSAPDFGSEAASPQLLVRRLFGQGHLPHYLQGSEPNTVKSLTYFSTLTGHASPLLTFMFLLLPESSRLNNKLHFRGRHDTV